jgi:hypothetical protein
MSEFRRALGSVLKPVDNKSADYTSDAVNLAGARSVLILAHDEGAFAGSITVKAALSDGTTTTAYKQHGAALTLDRVERLDFAPPLIKIDVVRTAGAVSVWVQAVR